MSLRWKIVLAITAISAVATLAVGAANYRSTRSQLYAEVDRSLVAVDARVTDRIAVDTLLPQRTPFSGFEAQYLRLDGEVAQTTFPSPVAPSAAELAVVGARGRSVFTDVTTAEGEYRVRTIGLPRGALQIARSLDETERVLRSLRARTLTWTLAVIAAATVAGWLIAGRVTASLRRLTSAAEHVESTGRLDVLVGESGADEVGRLGGAFDRMLAALRRSRDDQQRLVQDAGHELRTPLTSLRTNLDVLERHPSMGDEDRAAILADLRAETDELTHLVDEIVTVASGSFADEPYEQVDVASIARDVASRFERRAERPVVVTGSSPTLLGQPGSLQRAVSCLVENACKFDRSDQPIEVTIEVVGGGVVVTVADHGPGIPAAELDRVFDRFHRAVDARTMPGSGLGLSIVRDIARRHGGEAFAGNRPEGGALVGFRIGVLAPPG